MEDTEAKRIKETKLTWVLLSSSMITIFQMLMNPSKMCLKTLINISVFGDNIKPFGIFKACKSMISWERMLKNGLKFLTRSDKEEKHLIPQRTRRSLLPFTSTMAVSSKKSTTNTINGTKKSSVNSETSSREQ